MAQSKRGGTRKQPDDGQTTEASAQAKDSPAAKPTKPATPRPRKASLTDALAATHRHTVPVLPALPPLDQPDAERSTGSLGRPTDSYARAPLAPGSSGSHRSSGGSSGVRRTNRPRPAAPAGEETGRILLERAEFDPDTSVLDALAEARTARMPEASADVAQAQTALVPVRGHARAGGDGERLPALRSDGPRDLALAAASPSETIFIRGSRKPPKPYSMRIVPRRMGPRPFILQFLIAMVTAMTLFGSLALASPLGRSAVFGTSFDAYASSVPWIPPTPTPVPTATPIPLTSAINPPNGPNPGTATVIAEIQAVFGQYSPGALNISRCESGYDPNARNPFPVGDSHAMGVFQILYPSTWNSTSYSQYTPYDYKMNIRAAWEIFSRDGYSWREWECKPY